jgi:hypothetical protein
VDKHVSVLSFVLAIEAEKIKGAESLCQLSSSSKISILWGGWGGDKINFMQLSFSVSNWQKVQFNTHLLKWRSQVFIHIVNGWLKLNEINANKVSVKKWD